MRISSLILAASAAAAVALSTRLTRTRRRSVCKSDQNRNPVEEELVEEARIETVGKPALSGQTHTAEDSLLEQAGKKSLTLAELERAYIEKVFEAEGRNQTRAAKTLGIARRTLYRKLREYGLIEDEE